MSQIVVGEIDGGWGLVPVLGWWINQNQAKLQALEKYWTIGEKQYICDNKLATVEWFYQIKEWWNKWLIISLIFFFQYDLFPSGPLLYKQNSADEIRTSCRHGYACQEEEKLNREHLILYIFIYHSRLCVHILQ